MPPAGKGSAPPAVPNPDTGLAEYTTFSTRRAAGWLVALCEVDEGFICGRILSEAGIFSPAVPPVDGLPGQRPTPPSQWAVDAFLQVIAVRT